MIDINRHLTNFNNTFSNNIVNDVNEHINDKLESVYDKYVNKNINDFKEKYINTPLRNAFGNNQLLKEFTGTPKINMYEIYIDKILLPVAPEKIEIKNKNMNKSYELVNGSEFNILKEDGLKTISFECLLPTSVYPFSQYKNGFKNPEEYINELLDLKELKKSFKLKIIRGEPFDTNIEVSLEDITLCEDAVEGRDIIVKLTFKEFRPLEVKIIKMISVQNNNNKIPNAVTSNNNSIENSNSKNVSNKGIKEKVRHTKKRKVSSHKSKKNEKNAVLTSRRHTGSAKKTNVILKASGNKTYTQPIPIVSSW